MQSSQLILTVNYDETWNDIWHNVPHMWHIDTKRIKKLKNFSWFRKFLDPCDVFKKHIFTIQCEPDRFTAVHHDVCNKSLNYKRHECKYTRDKCHNLVTNEWWRWIVPVSPISYMCSKVMLVKIITCNTRKTCWKTTAPQNTDSVPHTRPHWVPPPPWPTTYWPNGATNQCTGSARASNSRA